MTFKVGDIIEHYADKAFIFEVLAVGNKAYFLRHMTNQNEFSYGVLETEKNYKLKPITHVRYANVYRNGITFYETRTNADNNASASRVARIRVELTEGQFDE